MVSLFIGNLPFNVKEDDLRALFEQYGTVHAVKLVRDRESGRPRGFGFVEMDSGAADQAIHHLNHVEMGGRLLRVNRARERGQRQGGRRQQG